MLLRARRLTAEAYRRYGDVVAAGLGRPRNANMGTAARFDFLAELENRRPRARLNVCVFRCAPFRGRRFDAKLLEKHPGSTQAFLPMTVRRYLAVVALGGARPDLSTAAAFVSDGSAGITYRPGVWHHPMIALDRAGDFSCLVYEDGGASDTVVLGLDSPLSVSLR